MGINRELVPPHLHERYAIKPQRLWLRALVGASATVLVLGFFWTIGDRIVSEGNVTLIGWKSVSETAVEITWTLNRPDEKSVWCIAKVQDEDRFDVGFATFWIADSGPNQTYRITVNTRGDNFAVPTPTCSAEGWDNLAGAHFKPGIFPPAQSEGLAAPWQPEPSPISQ
jgi:hypothetical protein